MWTRSSHLCVPSGLWTNKSTYEAQLAAHGRLVYTNVGDSMMPLIRQNRDLLVVEAKPAPYRKYDAVLYKRPNGQYVLHRIIGVRQDGYVLCGDNRWRREYGVQDSWILGVLTAVVRDGKEFSVSRRSYRLAVRLWCELFWIRSWILRIRDRIRREMRKRGK